MVIQSIGIIIKMGKSFHNKSRAWDDDEWDQEPVNKKAKDLRDKRKEKVKKIDDLVNPIIEENNNDT